MKRYFLVLLFSFFFVSFVHANESSEDTYTLVEACKLSSGIHLGQILALEKDSRFRDVVVDTNYTVGSFYRRYDTNWLGESLFFIVNDNGGMGEQRYSELFIVNCSPTSGQTVHFEVHRSAPKTQYSPEVVKVTDAYILLDDWQNIEGKSYHVSMIFDRSNSTFTHLRDEVLRKYAVIKAFVKNNQFAWQVKATTINM